MERVTGTLAQRKVTTPRLLGSRAQLFALLTMLMEELGEIWRPNHAGASSAFASAGLFCLYSCGLMAACTHIQKDPGHGLWPQTSKDSLSVTTGLPSPGMHSPKDTPFHSLGVLLLRQSTAS